MKNLSFTICFLLIQSLSLFTQTKIDINKIPEHPRLLLLRGEEKAILANVKADKNWARVHKIILTESDKMLALPTLERVQIGRRLLDKSRECLRRIFFLSYAYRTTLDKKYLVRAEQELLKVSNFSDWNPSHFLDVAEMTMGVAIGYDWLFADLSDSTRQIIKQAIVKKGIEPSFDKKYNYWLRASHNWNQVCNAGLAFGALAIAEDSSALAKTIVERAVETIKLPMEDYKPDGAYPEGYSYWGYGTSFNVLFCSAVERIFGSDFGLSDTEGYLKTGSYMTHMIGSSGLPFNYSDAGNGAGLNPAMFWFAQRKGDPSLLFMEKKLLANGERSMRNDRILPALMIWGKDLDFKKIVEPKELTWVGQGKNPVAMLRTSWVDSTAIFVGIKAGSPSVNHGHMDIGSFVMDAGGVRWAMDFGMQDYESLESKGVKLWAKEQNGQRWQVYRYNNFAHNTLTFNDSLQRVEGFAKINSVTTQPQFLSAISDISEVYKGQVKSAKRGIAIAEQKYVAVRDEIETGEKSTTVRWVMATSASVTLMDDGMAMLTQKGKKLFLKITTPNVSIQKWDATPKNSFDALNTGKTLVGFEVKLPKNSKQTLSVLLMPDMVYPMATLKDLPPLADWK
jgi:hypothetical protein